MKLLPLPDDPFTAPTDRDMVPSERREFVRTHRTCIFGYDRKADGPAMTVVYYIPTHDDELLVSTLADRSKAKAAARHGKVSLCVLEEHWPFTFLKVYADAVGGRMSCHELNEDARPIVQAMAAAEDRLVIRLPALLDVRHPTAAPPRREPAGQDHPLGIRQGPLGCGGHYARYTGTAPIAASSGPTQRHRLNPRGNRQLNRALHIAAVTQIRNDTPGRAYHRRKLNESKSTKEALRASNARSPRSFTGTSSPTPAIKTQRVREGRRDDT
jgi:hypothetical protein